MKISIKSIYVLLGSLFITISLLFLFYVHELNSVSKELSLIGRDRNVMILKSQELRHSSDRVQVSIDEKNSAITNLFRKMYSLIIAGILLFLLVIYFTIKRILIPVKALTQSISLYDKGDINIEERIYYHDEIGLMTQQYFNLKNKLLDERNMFLEGPVVIFKWRNAEGWPIEYVSTNVEMILGYSREEFFKNTITYSDIIDKKYQGKVAEEVNDAVDKKIKHFDHAPYEIIRKTGEKIYISDHTSLLYDEQGNITHFLGYITDISKTIAIEHELIKSKETIERYLNIAAEIILTLDKNGTITLLNESGHKLLGYENGTLIGKNWFETSLPKAIVPDVKVIFNKLMMGDLENVENYENSLLTRDGKDIMVFWHNTLLRDDEDRIIGVLSSGENITLYKQAEIALKESEYKLLEAQKISQLGHWELDLTNNKLLWSDEIYRIFNLEPKQFDANYDEFLENIHPEDKDFVNKAYSDSLKTKRPYDIVHRLLMKNGSIKYVNEKCTTEFDENGKALRSMGTIQDITDYKSGEIALRESETKFRILADHTADWEYWVLPDNTYKYVSPSCKSISGYSNDEFIENPALFFDIIHP
ncbi:PAS domain-containing protein, partial [bacterium]|nr:PAS domain-containing protein [bacterium]